MESLFGHIYPAGKTFRHDDLMRRMTLKRRPCQALLADDRSDRCTPTPAGKRPVLGSPFQTPLPRTSARDDSTMTVQRLEVSEIVPATAIVAVSQPEHLVPAAAAHSSTRQIPQTPSVEQQCLSSSRSGSCGEAVKDSFSLSPEQFKTAMRQEAYDAALGRGALRWDELNLISVSTHEREDVL